ncbi:unnamed protein product [Vitrella brassicaformis CCMP3155]|uniref:CRIM domain-containing protein n=2 Tax=Vitrella brassicaformis TaxID=1169539 RepID=A0A0G4EXU1_VITBC|nr:unnamed protein product [Vitrella brassicaformis CCMP3155]|eukprot:CEM03429.1 unnamed protein product [Vitrella brassicaformis CCMP3155]
MDFTEASELSLLFELNGLRGGERSTNLVPDCDRDVIAQDVERLLDMSPKYEVTHLDELDVATDQWAPHADSSRTRFHLHRNLRLLPAKPPTQILRWQPNAPMRQRLPHTPPVHHHPFRGRDTAHHHHHHGGDAARLRPLGYSTHVGDHPLGEGPFFPRQPVETGKGGRSSLGKESALSMALKKNIKYCESAMGLSGAVPRRPSAPSGRQLTLTIHLPPHQDSTSVKLSVSASLTLGDLLSRVVSRFGRERQLRYRHPAAYELRMYDEDEEGPDYDLPPLESGREVGKFNMTEICLCEAAGAAEGDRSAMTPRGTSLGDLDEGALGDISDQGGEDPFADFRRDRFDSADTFTPAVGSHPRSGGPQDEADPGTSEDSRSISVDFPRSHSFDQRLGRQGETVEIRQSPLESDEADSDLERMEKAPMFYNQQPSQPRWAIASDNAPSFTVLRRPAAPSRPHDGSPSARGSEAMEAEPIGPPPSTLFPLTRRGSRAGSGGFLPTEAAIQEEEEEAERKSSTGSEKEARKEEKEKDKEKQKEEWPTMVGGVGGVKGWAGPRTPPSVMASPRRVSELEIEARARKSSDEKLMKKAISQPVFEAPTPASLPRHRQSSRAMSARSPDTSPTSTGAAQPRPRQSKNASVTFASNPNLLLGTPPPGPSTPASRHLPQTQPPAPIPPPPRVQSWVGGDGKGLLGHRRIQSQGGSLSVMYHPKVRTSSDEMEGAESSSPTPGQQVGGRGRRQRATIPHGEGEEEAAAAKGGGMIRCASDVLSIGSKTRVLTVIGPPAETPAVGSDAPTADQQPRTVVQISEESRLFDLLSLVARQRDEAFTPATMAFERVVMGRPQRLQMGWQVKDIPQQDRSLRLVRKDSPQQRSTAQAELAGKEVRPPLSMFLFNEYTASIASEYHLHVTVRSTSPPPSLQLSPPNGPTTPATAPAAKPRPCVFVVDRNRVYHKVTPLVMSTTQTPSNTNSPLLPSPALPFAPPPPPPQSGAHSPLPPAQADATTADPFAMAHPPTTPPPAPQRSAGWRGGGFWGPLFRRIANRRGESVPAAAAALTAAEGSAAETSLVDWHISDIVTAECIPDKPRAFAITYRKRAVSPESADGVSRKTSWGWGEGRDQGGRGKVADRQLEVEYEADTATQCAEIVAKLQFLMQRVNEG